MFRDMKTKALIITVLFASLTFVSGLIVLPVGPIPITMQTFFVILAGFYLQPKDAFMSMVLHILLKVVVVGPQVLFMPSSGFLYGFVVSSFLGSLYIRNARKENEDLAFSRVAVFLLLTSAIPYVTGIPFMAYILNVINGGQHTLFSLLKIGLFPFVVGDLLKIFLAYGVIKRHSSLGI